MFYRFWYNPHEFEDCEDIEKLSLLIELHDFFIISIIECKNISRTDIKADENDMVTDVGVSESDVTY